MPRTPDRFSGVREEEAIQLEDTGTQPTNPGEIRYSDGAFSFRDAAGLVEDIRSVVAGLDALTHRAVDQLVHDIAETSFMEVTRSLGKVSAITYWTDPGKTEKIRETNITRSSGQVSVVVVKQYNEGSLVETLTGTINRADGRVVSMDWVLT